MGYDPDKILDVIEAVAKIAGTKPLKLFFAVARAYLQVSPETVLLIAKASQRWDFPESPSTVYKMSMLPHEVIRKCIEASSIITMVRRRSLMLVFTGLDNTKIRLSIKKGWRRKGLLLVECVVDIFSGTAHNIGVDERVLPKRSRFTINLLFADGEFFKPEFIMYCFSNGILPIIKPWSDVFSKNRDPILKAYAVFFYRHLWWLYKLRKIVERFFSGMFRRGKLLSLGRGTGRREALLAGVGRNIFNVATLPDPLGVLRDGFVVVDF